MKVVIKIGKESSEIPQTIGVRQGDNLSPVLFLFLMSAFAEALETEWGKKGIEKAEFSRVSTESFQNLEGQLLGQKPKKGFANGVIFNILQILYIDDGAFIFNSRKDLIKGVNLINDMFKKFGLEMHIGRNGKASKTECIFFPPPGFFKQKALETSSATPLLSTSDEPSMNTGTPSSSDSRILIEKNHQKKTEKKEEAL
ncbi:MAG: hypothetical protein GY874_04910 [Desulfobacteraceae bacterium]|nr:hypothetical protein [Desulfobacteraceae bacterium]